MAYLLFPGRHLVNTRFQEEYLARVLFMPLAALEFYDGQRPGFDDQLAEVVFAITSANQQNSRYNPVPFHVRAVGVDRFARHLHDALGIRYRLVGIPHYGHTPRFAANTLKEIEEQSEGELRLTPQNAAVLCSTPEVITQYRALGFAILPAELGEAERPLGPIDLVREIASLAVAWEHSDRVRRELSSATYSLWTDLPEVPRRVARLYNDPLLNETGDLTETRDYATYAAGMSNPAIIRLKYREVKPLIKSGRIVDEGCADGALLALIARDFPDSDLIGIEITDEFLALCRERQRRGDFGGTYTHFHQRNLLFEIFQPGSIDTTICNSTLHELSSYGEGAATVRAYLARKFRQTALGGRLIVRDVVGPENKGREVFLWCNPSDGSNEAPFERFDDADQLEVYLNGLSTVSRFRRFAREFRLAEHRAAGGEGDPISYREETRDGRSYFVLRLQQAMEFISKKDYTDNWQSELHEEFCFWSFSDWKRELAAAGFTVLEDSSQQRHGSYAYANPWLIENRFTGKVALYQDTPTGLKPLAWPHTNMILVGEKQP